MEEFVIENAHAPITLKITDFDTIKELHQTTTLSMKGTVAWMAPEVLTELRFSQKSDVWRLVHFSYSFMTSVQMHMCVVFSIAFLISENLSEFLNVRQSDHCDSYFLP